MGLAKAPHGKAQLQAVCGVQPNCKIRVLISAESSPEGCRKAAGEG